MSKRAGKARRQPGQLIASAVSPRFAVVETQGKAGRKVITVRRREDGATLSVQVPKSGRG